MTATLDAAAPAVEEQAGAITERLFEAVLGQLEISTVWLGVKLGLYDAITEPATPAQVADATGVIERYAREWLEQQAIAGLVTVSG